MPGLSLSLGQPTFPLLKRRLSFVDGRLFCFLDQPQHKAGTSSSDSDLGERTEQPVVLALAELGVRQYLLLIIIQNLGLTGIHRGERRRASANSEQGGLA